MKRELPPRKISPLNRFFQASISTWLIVLLTGCECVKENSFTGKLWNSDDFHHTRSIATNAPIQLFYARSADDFLLSYTEVREDYEKPLHRAYFLRENAQATQDQRRPRFIENETNMADLVTVAMTDDDSQTPRAHLDGTTLIVHTAEAECSTYAISSYEQSSGTAMKTLLTPVTVLGDTALVSLVAAIIGALMLGAGGASFAAP
jgi:hypothetical protein